MTRVAIASRISLTPSGAFLAVLPVLVLLLAAAMAIALRTGSTSTDFGDLLRTLLFPDWAETEQTRMLLDLRGPRILVAVTGGALLAVSGYLLQTVSRNGLADPGILGLSDGATVAVIVSAFFWPALSAGLSGLVALAGAVVVAGLVVGLGRRLLAGGGIILVGLALNIVLGSAVEIILASGTAGQFAQYLIWSRGTLNTVDGTDARLVASWFIGVVPLVLLTSRRLGPLLLGADEAEAVGVRVGATNAVLIVLAAAAAAPVVATCGPIAFVGLMAAHVARGIVGDRPTEVLFLAMPAGAIILLAADTAGRSLFAPVIVSAGVLVSVTGVLAFIAVAAMRGLCNRN